MMLPPEIGGADLCEGCVVKLDEWLARADDAMRVHGVHGKFARQMLLMVIHHAVHGDLDAGFTAKLGEIDQEYRR
jgi:hypothetical protein